MILIIKYNLSYNYKKIVLLYFNYYKNCITKNKNILSQTQYLVQSCSRKTNKYRLLANVFEQKYNWNWVITGNRKYSIFVINVLTYNFFIFYFKKYSMFTNLQMNNTSNKIIIHPQCTLLNITNFIYKSNAF